MAQTLWQTHRWQRSRQYRYILFGLGVLLLLGTSSVVAQTLARQQLNVPPLSPLSCQDPGTPQESGKTPVITNNSENSLAKGIQIRWSASDGDAGNIILPKVLPAGKTIQAKGQPGSRYTCHATITS